MVQDHLNTRLTGQVLVILILFLFQEQSIVFNICRITRPLFTIHQKLDASGIIRVWTYKKVGWVIRLESEPNICILDEYGKY